MGGLGMPVDHGNARAGLLPAPVLVGIYDRLEQPFGSVVEGDRKLLCEYRSWMSSSHVISDRLPHDVY